LISKNKEKKPELGLNNIDCLLKVIYNSLNLHGSDLEELVKTTKKLQEIQRITKEEMFK